MTITSIPGAFRLPRTAGWLLFVAALAVIVSTPAGATTFKLTYEGAFNSQDALNLASAPSPTYLADDTPFTAIAIFSDTSQNLAAPVGVSGFVAYSPIMATLTVGGQTYRVASYNDDPAKGITVAVFDQTTPFGPGRYAIGFLQDPFNDGAGFIGDWSSASPDFLATDLVTTVFTQYNGVGYGSGVMGAVTPIPLYDSLNQEYALTLGNYEEEYADGSPLNTAVLTAIPEPGTLGLAGAALTLLAFARRVPKPRSA